MQCTGCGMAYPIQQLRGDNGKTKFALCLDCCYERMKKSEAIIEMMKKHEAEMSVSFLELKKLVDVTRDQLTELVRRFGE
jgi:hypothetical protein